MLVFMFIYNNPDSMDLPVDVIFQTFVSLCFYRNMAGTCFSNSLILG